MASDETVRAVRALPSNGGELRKRSVYDYHKTNADRPERRQRSINLIAGIKKTGTVKGFGRASPQKNFTEMGIGVRVVR